MALHLGLPALHLQLEPASPSISAQLESQLGAVLPACHCLPIKTLWLWLAVGPRRFVGEPGRKVWAM